VLKKAGIVVATAAAGLLAVSPLAFAGDKDDHDRDHDGKKVKIEDVNHNDDSNTGLINIGDTNVAVNSCDIDAANVIDDVAGVVNLLSLVEQEESEVNDCKQDADAGVVKQKND
jgi:hypothetical protein